MPSVPRETSEDISLRLGFRLDVHAVPPWRIRRRGGKGRSDSGGEHEDAGRQFQSSHHLELIGLPWGGLEVWRDAPRGAEHRSRVGSEPVVMQVEAISPELVLVDPDLARVERERLAEGARIAAFLRQPPSASGGDRLDDVPSVVVHHDRLKTASSMLLLLSLFLNGAFLASVLTGSDAASQVAAPVPTPAPSLTTSPAAAATLGSTHVVEHKVLAAIFQSPSKLPRRWLDATSGLPKNGLRVRCRRASSVRLFRCTIKLPGESGGTRVVYHGTAAKGGSLKWTRPRGR